MKLRLKQIGTEDIRTVELHRLKNAGQNGASHLVKIDDHEQEIHLQADGSGRGWMTQQGRVSCFYTYTQDDRTHVWLDGEVYELENVNSAPRRGGKSGAAIISDTLKSPMPGTILQIVAKPGAGFEAHESLIVMESMKMEMSLSVPHSGTVTEILCSEGDLVEQGAILVRLGDA